MMQKICSTVTSIMGCPDCASSKTDCSAGSSADLDVSSGNIMSSSLIVSSTVEDLPAETLAPTKRIPSELYFILDCSGSMAVNNTLAIFVSNLKAGCADLKVRFPEVKVTVIKFGTTMEVVQDIDQMTHQNMGSTNFYPALEQLQTFVFENDIPGRRIEICIIGDGKVDNEDLCVRRINTQIRKFPEGCSLTTMRVFDAFPTSLMLGLFDKLNTTPSLGGVCLLSCDCMSLISLTLRYDRRLTITNHPSGHRSRRGDCL